MTEHEISEVDRVVAGAFGRSASTAPVETRRGSLEAFRDAGFCQEDAEQGVRLLESGNYFGFEDVATSMGAFDPGFRARNPAATAQRIREVASTHAGVDADGPGSSAGR